MPQTESGNAGHKRWVRISHWIITASFLALVVSGYLILMVHPRLYWGEVGNDLTPALIEFPISRNYQHGGWEKSVPFNEGDGEVVSAARTYEIFNQNGMARSLHFLAAWFLVVTGAAYLLIGIFRSHFRRHFIPRSGELSWLAVLKDLKNHLRLKIRAATGGPHYGLLQKCTYCAVVFVALPLAVVTGLAMSPAITAAYPFLSALFGGFQSARTIHFFVSIILVLFLAIHVLMIVKSGFKRQMRGMILGKSK